jgi:threonylcarbamoyladenosine tRNA methylthiotransferase MtaB
MHIFPYSHHKNTPAFYYKNIVNSDIDRRINIITDLNNNFKKKYLQKFINKKINILFEKSHENNMQIGQSNYFFKVKVNANKKMQNQIKKIQIVKIYNYQLYGKVLN